MSNILHLPDKTSIARQLRIFVQSFHYNLGELVTHLKSKDILFFFCVQTFLNLQTTFRCTHYSHADTDDIYKEYKYTNFL